MSGPAVLEALAARAVGARFEVPAWSRARAQCQKNTATVAAPSAVRLTTARAHRLAAAHAAERCARLQASARVELRLLSAIHQAAESDWRAAAWLLERRDPRYARASERHAAQWIAPARALVSIDYHELARRLIGARARAASREGPSWADSRPSRPCAADLGRRCAQP